MPDFGNSNLIMPLKAAIYDPYLDTLGGGERYCLTVAEILSKKGYDVDLFWSGDPTFLTKAADRFALDLKPIKIVKDIFNLPLRCLELAEDNLNSIKRPALKTSTIIDKYRITKKYHLFFYLSDGSIPLIFSKKNILHMQVPFRFHPNIQQKIATCLKARLFSQVVCNSRFTQKFIDQYLARPSVVLYPPVDILKFNPAKVKTNSILSVGRFDNILNAKKQDILIEAFKTLYRQQPNLDWKLILLGGSMLSEETNSFLKYLKKLARGYTVEFLVNPGFEVLKNYYSEAKIYWHAAGFGVDEDLHPESTEHFGISTVEAMASGAVPIVVNKGGLKEIVINNKNGFLWRDVNDLVAQTLSLIKSPQQLKSLSQKAQESCQQFSKENFQKEFLSLITPK